MPDLQSSSGECLPYESDSSCLADGSAALLARVQSFLPQLQEANNRLSGLSQDGFHLFSKEGDDTDTAQDRENGEMEREQSGDEDEEDVNPQIVFVRSVLH